MAEQLGEAVLKITVDDSVAKDKLGQLRQELNRIESRAGGGGGARGRSAGGARESVEAQFTAYKKLYALEQQINNLAQQGLNIDRLRAQLVQAFAATARSNFGTAKQLTNELGLQVQQERSILNLKQKQDNAAKKLQQSELQVAAAIAKQAAAQKQLEESRSKAARAALSAAGPGTTGLAPLSTTPAAQRQQQNTAARIAAQERRAENRTSQTASGSGLTRFLREQDALAQAAESTRALAAALERRNASLSRLAETAASQTAGGSGLTRFLREQDQLAKSAAKTGARDAILTRRAEVRSLQTAGGGGLTSFLRDVRQREEGERRIAAIRKAGYKDAEFAEKTLAGLTKKRASTGLAAQRRRGQGGGADAGGVISSAVIGGSFPLLFGQGGGAAGGGLIGGLLGGAFGGGGGFAGSLLGTLVGQTADKFGELAKALQDPVKNLDALIQGANLSGKGVEELAKTLVELGRTSEADALLRADLSSTIDPVGVAKVAVANDAFSRSIGDIQERLGYLLAGPAVQFTGWLDQIIQRIVGLPQNGPTQRSATATRGQGTALSVGGVLLGAAGLAAAPFTGGASLGLALGGAGLIGAGATLSGSADFQQEQIASTKQIKKIQEEIAAIEQRRISLQRNILAATRSGSTNTAFELRLQDRLLELEADKSRLKVAFNAKSGPVSLNELQNFRQGIEAIELQKQAAKDAENTRKAGMEAAIKLETTQNSLALQAVRDRIGAAEQLSGIEAGTVRSTAEQVLNIRNGIAEAKRREQQLGADIDAARLRGGDAGEAEAARLVGQQQVAAEETKLRLIEGSTALRDAGAQLRKDAEDTVTALQKLREGNRRFLTPQEQANVDANLSRQVQQEALRRNIRVTFSGTPEEIRSEKRAFLDFGAEEQRLLKQGESIAAALQIVTQPLIESSSLLVTSITTLSEAVTGLASKDWTVQVTANVPIDAQSQLDLNRATTL